MISIHRKAVRLSLMIAVLVLIAASHFGPLIGITSMFSLDKEGSLPVWFESFLYLLSAGLLSLVAFDRYPTSRADGWRWGVFALFMLYLSVNTTAEINKRIVSKLTGWTGRVGGSLFDLVLFLLLAAALIVILWPVLSKLPARIRSEMFLAGFVFAVGAIVIDDLGDLLYRGSNEWFYLIEELLEFSAFVILIDALIAYLAIESSKITIDFRSDSPKEPESGG